MSFQAIKRDLIKKLGYAKLESRHKFLNAFDAQKKLVNKDEPLIFDIGANKGQTAMEYRDLYPEATIHSFEPFPESYHALCDLCKNDKKIVPHQIAFAEREGIFRFHVNLNSATNSFLPASPESCNWSPPNSLKHIDTIDVKSKTLDAFCRENQIDYIDILKMDTQGAEFNILQGAEGLLRDKKIGLIYSEVLFVPLYQDQPYFHDIAAFLKKFDYGLFDIFHHRYAPNGQIKWADALFVT